jgi:integrase
MRDWNAPATSRLGVVTVCTQDATMILVAVRHGLRSSELVDLRWDQIDFTHASARWCRGQARLSGSSSHAAPRLRLCLTNKGHGTRALQAYLGDPNIQHTVR